MKPLDAREERYTLIDMDGHICLFTNMRLDRDTIPDDLYCYDVRDDCGDGSFAQIQKFVLVDFWGSILTKEPIELHPQWHCYWPVESEPEYYSNASFSMEQFRTEPLENLLAMARGEPLADRIQNAQDRVSSTKEDTRYIEKAEQEKE